MPQKRPFISFEDGSQFLSSYTRTQFRRLRKAEKRELMVQWFSRHFEDPVHRTSYVSAEGGYLWNWGGPHDARDALYSQFGDLIDEKLIEEVANELESEGTLEWAPAPSDDDYEQDDEPPNEPMPLEIYTDEPSPRYGSAEDLEARGKATASLERLEHALARPPGLGHNGPPEPIEEADLSELRRSVTELKREFSRPRPVIAMVKRWAKPLRDVLIAAAKWAAQKADKAVDAAMGVIGGGIGAYIVAHFLPPIHDAFGTLVQWLEIAAKTLL